MEETHALFETRRQKMLALREKGVAPYGQRFEATGSIAEVRGRFADGRCERIAGRITAHRDMGKSHFLDLTDSTGRLQIFVHAKEVGPDAYAIFQLLDIGDFLGVEGEAFTTKTGELTLRVKELTVLSKALRPMPDKWHGLADVELRYRQRYLDLLANPESKTVFKQRIAIIREIRHFLEDRGFLEVETPMMQPVAGGAAAEPFKTHHNALNMDLYLRIAPELYLKRLLVGGFDRVFELNRSFRNEGVSRRHNPEFTMLEAYWAYADFEQMADMVEEMVTTIAEKVIGTLQVEHKDAEGKVVRTINLARPWRRAPYKDLVEEAVPGWFSLTPEGRRDKCRELKIEISAEMADFEVTQHVFEKLVEEKTFDPCFVTHCPQELVPLAKPNPADPSVVDVYELVMNGQEISPGYSELNDPIVQRRRLEEQAGEEKQKIDEDFLTALEHGMPPAGGIGIGLDRLTMMLTGAESIRDVILFPHMKGRG
ncbi:MAG: lysine--tRNA ligase [Chthoniobacteraceae bacterium]|nr:lysine--tRNA ligase [Chthoniobacteraceae bacterium]